MTLLLMFMILFVPQVKISCDILKAKSLFHLLRHILSDSILLPQKTKQKNCGLLVGILYRLLCLLTKEILVLEHFVSESFGRV